MKKFLMIYAGVALVSIGLSVISTEENKVDKSNEVDRRFKIKLSTLKRFTSKIELNEKNIEMNSSILRYYMHKSKPDSVEEADVLRCVEDNDQYAILVKVWGDYLNYMLNKDKTSLYLANRLASKEKYTRAIIKASNLTENDVTEFLDQNDNEKCWSVIKTIMEVI